MKLAAEDVRCAQRDVNPIGDLILALRKGLREIEDKRVRDAIMAVNDTCASVL